MEPARTSEFIRVSNIAAPDSFIAKNPKTLLSFGLNPYAVTHEKQKSISRVKSAPRYQNNASFHSSKNVMMQPLAAIKKT